MDASKKMKKKKEKKQRKQKQKQKQKQIVKTNVKVNVQSSGGSGGSSIPSAQPHYIIPPQFKDTSGENVKLNNILDTMKKQQEENKLLMNRINQQELNKDMGISFVDNNEDNIILEDISRNQTELNNNLEDLDFAVSEEAQSKRRGRPKLYEGETEEQKRIRLRLQKYEREQKKKMSRGGSTSE